MRLAPGTGNHKGCPYDGLAGGYFQRNDETIVEYLQAALEENDPAFFMKAVGNVARAKGMTSIAEEAQLGRESLYMALSGERDPRIGTVMKVLDALGIRLTVASSSEALMLRG